MKTLVLSNKEAYVQKWAETNIVVVKEKSSYVSSHMFFTLLYEWVYRG